MNAARKPALLFGELADDADLLRLAQDQVAIHRERLDNLQHIAEMFQQDSARANRLVPLSLGIRIEKAALEFWQERLDAAPVLRSLES